MKDGRLILEATINLLKPYESYQKYFKENFKYLNKITNDNNENMLSELDKTNNNQEVYIYKSDLSEAEEIVMNSIINNDEKYLNN